MAQYVVSDAGLTAVANAIRTKGGTSAQLAFPAGFVSAINDISGGGGGSEVPAGYTQLEYIESDGTALIDTGKVWASGRKIEISYCRDATAANSTYWHLFGAPNCFAQNAAQTTGGGSQQATGTWRINGAGNQSSKRTPCAPCTLVIEETAVKCYGYKETYPEYNIFSASGTAETSDKSLSIFARHTNSDAWDYKGAGIILYRWKLYDNGTLIQDLVPAKRDADDVIGLYDIVGNTFLTNAAGSGSFTGGAL